jgi:hypothetical protein
MAVVDNCEPADSVVIDPIEQYRWWLTKTVLCTMLVVGLAFVGYATVLYIIVDPICHGAIRCWVVGGVLQAAIAIAAICAVVCGVVGMRRFRHQPPQYVYPEPDYV